MNKRIYQGEEHKGKYVIQDHYKKLQRIEKDIHDITSSYKYLNERLEEINSLQSDVLHYIEFAQLDVQRGYKAYKRLREVQLERRMIKDELEVCKLAYETVKNLEFMLPNLSKTISKIKKNENTKSNRAYYVRNKKENTFTDFDEMLALYNSKINERVVIL